MTNLIFSFDVESLGLYGEGFAVGAVVLDDGKIADKCIFNCDIKNCDNYDKCPKSTLEWLDENVLKTLPEPNCKNTKEVRDNFWQFYTKYSKETIIADCGTPVEANFLRQCVLDDIDNRMWKAPYPLHELGTLLLLVGQDPIGTFARTEDELPKHNPLCDALQSARLWHEFYPKKTSLIM